MSGELFESFTKHTQTERGASKPRNPQYCNLGEEIGVLEFDDKQHEMRRRKISLKSPFKKTSR